MWIVRHLLLGLFCLAAASAASGKDILVNGSFKDKESNGYPLAWNIWGKIIPTDGKTGDSFLRVTGTGEVTNLAAAGGWQKLELPPKKTRLTYSGKLRCPDFAKRPGKPDDHYEIYFGAKFSDGHTKFFGSSKLYSQERSWKRVQFTEEIPTGAVEVIAYFNINGLGNLEITDLSVEAR